MKSIFNNAISYREYPTEIDQITQITISRSSKVTKWYQIQIRKFIFGNKNGNKSFRDPCPLKTALILADPMIHFHANFFLANKLDPERSTA